MTIEEIALGILDLSLQESDGLHTVASVSSTGLDCFAEPPNVRHEDSKQGFSVIRHEIDNSFNHTGPNPRELRYYGSSPPHQARCEFLVLHTLDRTPNGVGYNPPSVLSPTTAKVAVLRPVATYILHSAPVNNSPQVTYRGGDLIPDILHGPFEVGHGAAMVALAHGLSHVHNVDCSLFFRHDEVLRVERGLLKIAPRQQSVQADARYFYIWSRPEREGT
jgi:hypothetical protein